MLELFLCVLEEELQIKINRQRPPIARMSRIMKKLESQTRAAELQRAADQPAIEMLRRFYDAWQSRADDRTIDELLVEMGAFLKTAGGA